VNWKLEISDRRAKIHVAKVVGATSSEPTIDAATAAVVLILWLALGFVFLEIVDSAVRLEVKSISVDIFQLLASALPLRGARRKRKLTK